MAARFKKHMDTSTIAQNREKVNFYKGWGGLGYAF